jgi:glucan phosphoethanolaminetransferase (alkaline phosphatase superfamily)
MPGIVKEQNLINLPALYSRETQTISSIYSILSLTDSETGEATHNSFIGILKKHGYALNLLVGANTEGMWYHAPAIAPLLAERMPLHSRPKNAEEYARTMQEI